MINKIITTAKWLVVVLLLWLLYLFISIMSFPDGTLSDNADAAIVLGAAAYQSKPSPVFTERINHAINLYQAGKVGKLIFTGGIGESPNSDNKQIAESVVARDYALSKNVNLDDIYIETRSLTTKENLIYAQQIIKREVLNSTLIISDSLHLKRTMIIAKDLGIQAKPSATPTSRYQSLKTRVPFAFRELYFYHHYLLFSE